MNSEKLSVSFDELVSTNIRSSIKNKKPQLKRSLTKEYLLSIDVINVFGLSGINLSELSLKDFDSLFKDKYELVKKEYVFEEIIKEFGSENSFINFIKKEILNTYYTGVNKNWPKPTKMRSIIKLVEKMYKIKKDDDFLTVKNVEKEDLNEYLNNFIREKKDYKSFLFFKILSVESNSISSGIVYMILSVLASYMDLYVKITAGVFLRDIIAITIVCKFLAIFRFVMNIKNHEESLKKEYYALIESNGKSTAFNGKNLISKAFEEKKSEDNINDFIDDSMSYRRVVTPFDICETYSKKDFDNLSYSIFFPAATIKEILSNKEQYEYFQEKSADFVIK